MFTWGEQLGWFNPNVLDLPSSEAEYIKTLCQTLDKDSVKKFLFYGEMVPPPKLSGDNPILSAIWKAGQEATDMPAVMHSAWKAEDGSLGLAFTNMDNSSHSISYTIDVSDYQLPQVSRYIVEVIDGNDVNTKNRYKSPSFNRTENIPARSILILKIKADGR